MLDKNELRKIVRQKKREHSQEELAVLSQKICRTVVDHPRVRQAHTVLAYYSLPDEVNTHELVMQLLGEGKTVLLPKVLGGGIMEIRQFKGPDDMCEGQMHILEPTGFLFTDYDQIDVAIVPGMGFDAAGHRLGRGAGYYDRFLSQAPHLYKIGVCFAFQQFPQVPVTLSDISMDEVISD